MLTKAEAAARVARGAAHLDRVRPGWCQRIDIGTLTLCDPCRCIVGQVGDVRRGGFSAALVNLFGPYRYMDKTGLRSGAHYGVDLQTTEAVRATNWRTLQDAWIAAIADRRLATATQLVETPDRAESVR